MKTIEPITVTLQLARDLKEAGWPQEESVFHWQWYEDDGESMFGSFPSQWQCYQMDASYDDYDDGDCYAAPTAEEILRMLPTHLVVLGTGKMGGKGNKFHPVMTKWKDKGGDLYLMRYRRTGAPKNLAGSDVSGRTLVEAAAKLWLFMKKNNLLPPTV